MSQISFGVDKFEFSLGVFGYVTATAYYPNGNAKPTDSYGGNLTWVPYSPSSGQKPIRRVLLKMNKNQILLQHRKTLKLNRPLMKVRR